MCKIKYDKKIEKFLTDSCAALFSLDVLEIDSYTTIAQSSQILTLRQLLIYICKQKLESNLFEEVNKVIDVSIDAMYARKKFYESQ